MKQKKQTKTKRNVMIEAHRIRREKYSSLPYRVAMSVAMKEAWASIKAKKDSKVEQLKARIAQAKGKEADAVSLVLCDIDKMIVDAHEAGRHDEGHELNALKCELRQELRRLLKE